MIRVENEKEGHFLKEAQNNITPQNTLLRIVSNKRNILKLKKTFKNKNKNITHFYHFS